MSGTFGMGLANKLFIYAKKEPLREELQVLTESDKPSVVKRKILRDRILNKVVNFVETYITGMDTN